MSSQVPLNLDDTRGSPSHFVVPSWTACGLAVLICGTAAISLPNGRDRYAQMFADFNLKLPSFTQLAIDIPRIAVWGAALLTTAGLPAVQIRLYDKRKSTVIHFAAIAGWAVAYALFEMAMSQAFMNLTTGMYGGSAGGR